VIVIFSPLSPFVILISEPSVNPTVSQKEKKEKKLHCFITHPSKRMMHQALRKALQMFYCKRGTHKIINFELLPPFQIITHFDFFGASTKKNQNDL
jgi:hypothetical protein